MFKFKSKSKKTGPVKALGTSVYATNETSFTNRGKKEEKSKKTKKHGSKDDSLMDTSGKIKWKANPYATIKMWRPITMSTSITSEEDVYQSFNFQNPNDVSDNIQSKEQSFPLFQTTKNGNVEYPVKIHSHHKQLSISIPEEETSLPSTPPRACGKVRSMSENSHNIMSDSAMDIVKEIMDKVYTTSDFEQANSDVDSLLVQLKFTLAALPSSKSNQKSTEFDNCQDALITKTKQFINDAKLLVSSANNTHKKLAHYLTVAMHTLAGVFLHSQSFIIMLESAESAQNIGQEVVKVCHAFKNTVTASQTAVGKTLSDPQMKYLMRQAHNLAGVLSILLKDLKTVKTSL